MLEIAGQLTSSQTHNFFVVDFYLIFELEFRAVVVNQDIVEHGFVGSQPQAVVADPVPNERKLENVGNAVDRAI